MPRVTKSVSAHAKHKKILKSTKGHYGARSRLYKTAKQSNIKSMQYAFRDRKNKKEILGLYGLQGLTLQLENVTYHIQN